MLSNQLTTSARERAVRHSIVLSGVAAAYFEYPASDSNAESIVMIHGYRGNHRGLEAIAGGLEKYRVIMPDLPGFGESNELVGEHSVKAYAGWLGEFMLALNLSKSAHLVGHSFGTLVVGRYASYNECRSVILINPISAPALTGPRGFLTRITKVFYRIGNLLPETLGAVLLRSPIAVQVMSSVMAKTSDKELRKWIHRQHLENFSDFSSVRVATEAYDASISSDLSQMASEINSPVLVIAAELDDITSIERQRQVTHNYPNATIQEIQGVGHLVHYEAPAEAARLISGFVEGTN